MIIVMLAVVAGIGMRRWAGGRRAVLPAAPATVTAMPEENGSRPAVEEEMTATENGAGMELEFLLEPGEAVRPEAPPPDSGELIPEAIFAWEVERKELPRAYNLERIRPPVSLLPRAENPLTGADRELAEKLIGGMQSFFAGIDGFEFDLAVSRNDNPPRMNGHVVCDRPERFVFDGIVGKAAEAHIESENGKGIMILKNAERRPNSAPDFSEYEEIFWFTLMRQENFVDVFDSALPGQEILDSAGNRAACTVLGAGDTKYFFENGKGRLVKIVSKAKETVFEYDQDAYYPRRVERKFIATKEKIVTEFKNLKIRPKTGKTQP